MTCTPVPTGLSERLDQGRFDPVLVGHLDALRAVERVTGRVPRGYKGVGVRILVEEFHGICEVGDDVAQSISLWASLGQSGQLDLDEQTTVGLRKVQDEVRPKGIAG